MADAHSKLADALANAKNKRVSSAPAAKSSKPAAAAPANAAPSTSASRPAPKKNDQPKNKPQPKPKKSPKPKTPGLGASSMMLKSLSKFATNVVEEFKTATSEISPTALTQTATGSIQSIKNAVFKDLPPHPAERASDSKPEPGQNDQNDSQTEIRNAAAPDTVYEGAKSAPGDQALTPDEPKTNVASAEDTKPAAPTSPAKVQRMPSKKKNIPDETTESPLDPEVSQEELVQQSGAGTLAEDSAPAQLTSPAKVVRAPSQKKASTQPEGDPGGPRNWSRRPAHPHTG